MKILAIATTALITLSACSLTLPVQGQMVSGAETFTGSATGYMDGGGTLSITLTSGRTCEGDFVYTTGRKGEGVFVCSDGKSGPFSFVSTGSRGTGTGNIGGVAFTFTFG